VTEVAAPLSCPATGTATEQLQLCNSTPSDLDLIPTGSVLIGQNQKLTAGPEAPATPPPTLSGIWAKTNIYLWVGDDLDAPASTEIVAGGTITIHGDTNRVAGATAAADTPNTTNADAGTGTNLYFAGRVGGLLTAFDGTSDKTDLTQIFAHTDNDLVTFYQTYLGTSTEAYGSYDVSRAAGLPAADGADTFLVDHLQTMDSTQTTNGTNGDTLFLDGEGQSDTYTVYTWGSTQAAHHYVIDVLDSGAPGIGNDTLSVYGYDSTATTGTDDIFLLRAVTSIPGLPPATPGGTSTPRTATAPAFVALLHATLAIATTPPVSDSAFEVERVAYDSAIDDGGLKVYGQGGNDVFAADDITASATLDGGAGNDTFQFGQLYGLKRDATEPGALPSTNGGSLTTQDVFATAATTRGWLSNGTSRPVLATGGDGNDIFTVYSNQAALTLHGDNGDDLFTVRAFALAQTTGNCSNVNDASCQIVWRGNPADRVAMPVLNGSQVAYHLNDPVSIDGGSGFDKTAVLGTEFGDHLVVEANGVYGAGLTVTYTTIEALEVDALEGDDTIDVTGTAAGMSTRVIGGLGSDVVNVAGDVYPDVVTKLAFTPGSHLLSALAGPLAVVGGESGANRGLWKPILLPG